MEGNEQISSDNHYSSDDLVLEQSEMEETASVSSCFASEDTTEDSGVLSSPSDIVSLDSQSDSLRSRDKSVSVQDTLAGAESPVIAESCSLKNASFNSEESGNFHCRSQRQINTQGLILMKTFDAKTV
uniref:Uncharacterized protein n=1 Tax=Sphaerodactylus townsendi TaxID=933632 RepID=A0ACB8FTU0_9SAUR